MSKRILIPVIVVLVVLLGGGAAYALTKPKQKHSDKINGSIYILPKEFTLNMSGGQYATLTVALLLPPGQSEGVTVASDPPPTGFGSLTDEAVIRAIITSDVTDQPASALLQDHQRAHLQRRILEDIRHKTDTKVSSIYFTDIAVQ